MRRGVGVPACLGALALIGSLTGPASAGQPSGVKGMVLDTTCPGPCIVGQQPLPYAGSGLRVVIRRLPAQGVVKRLSPKGGSFSTRLRPGLYRVNAYVNGDRWQGEAKRVRVRRAQFSRLTLHVHNSCILAPCPPCPPCPSCLECPVPAQGLVICPPCPLPTAAIICEPCPPGQVCIL
jgi:hypothetical protein